MKLETLAHLRALLADSRKMLEDGVSGEKRKARMIVFGFVCAMLHDRGTVDGDNSEKLAAEIVQTMIPFCVFMLPPGVTAYLHFLVGEKKESIEGLLRLHPGWVLRDAYETGENGPDYVIIQEQFYQEQLAKKPEAEQPVARPPRLSIRTINTLRPRRQLVA